MSNTSLPSLLEVPVDMTSGETSQFSAMSSASMTLNGSSWNGPFSSQLPLTTSSVSSTSTLVPNTRTLVVNSATKPTRKKVSDLKCSEIRWFYRKENDSKWTSFTGNIYFTIFCNLIFLFYYNLF